MKWVWINLAIAGGGFLLSLIGFAGAPAGGTFLVFWGAVLFGGVAAVRNGLRASEVSSDPAAALRRQLRGNR